MHTIKIPAIVKTGSTQVLMRVPQANTMPLIDSSGTLNRGSLMSLMLAAAERTKKAREWDRLQNGGGDDYNPYRPQANTDDNTPSMKGDDYSPYRPQANTDDNTPSRKGDDQPNYIKIMMSPLKKVINN